MKRLALVLFMWLAQVAPLAAHAQTAPTRCNPAMQCCRQANLPGDPGCAGGGNPINLLTGNKYQQEVDLAPLPGVQGVEIVRRYNSAGALDTHPNRANRANGLLGKGWRLSYEIELTTNGEHQRTLTLADGSQVVFTRGVLQPTHFIAADLGQGRLVEQGDGAEWQRLDGQRFSFNRQGRLVQIRAASGEFTSLAHDGQGRLIKVIDPQGRSLVLHYADAHSATRYRGVSAIDTPVGRIEYRYGSGEQAANLVQVTLPGQVQRRYHHEDPRHPGALTGISIRDDKGAEQRLGTYLYDAQGLAVLSVKGAPAKLQADASGQALKPYRLQDDSGLEQVIVERGNDSVTVLDSLNQKSHAKWAEIAGQRLITEFRGAGCAHCPPPNTRWAYDRQGRLTETTQLDGNGQPIAGERHDLDAWGRVRAAHRVSYAGGQAQTELVARFEYAAPFAEGSSDATQPTLIARPSVVPGKEHHTRIAYNAHGQPTAITEEGFSPVDDKGEAHATPITRTTTYTYSRVNGRSVLMQIDGPLDNGPKNTPEDSDITTMQWDERGSVVVAFTQPMNLVERMTYDDVGRLAQRTDADGVRAHWFYGAFNAGHPSATVRGGLATGYAYDTLGRVRAVADNSGRGIALTYDAAGRLTTVTDAQGYRQELLLDSEGKVQRAGQFEPDQLQPLRAAYRFYDARQRLAKHLLPDGRISAYTYDDSVKGQGRLIEHVDGDDVLHLHRHNAQGQGARIDLTPNGSMRVALNEPSRSSATRTSSPHTQRDDFGRPVLQWRPEQGLQTRVFDAAGHLVREARRDRAGTGAGHTEQRFDAAGRLVERLVFNAQGRREQAVRTTYQGQRLESQRDDAQTTSYTYDAAGHVSSTTITLLDEQGRAAYSTALRVGLDAQGQTSTKTLADGQVMRMERQTATGVASRIALQTPFWAKLHEQLEHWLPPDSAHRVQAWLPRNNVAGDIAFHPYNGITGFTHGNGARTDKQFDLAGRVTSIKTAGQETKYGYGAGPRIKRIGEQALEYNGWGMLKEQATAKIIKTAAAANTNAAISPAKIEYDRQGRVVNDGINRYSFTAEGQVHTVSTQNGQPIARYRYNTQRQRVSKTVHTTGGIKTTYYLWHDGKLVAEIDGSGDHRGQLSAQYLYLSEDGKAQPIVKLEAAHASGNQTGHARTLAIHANHRGEPTAMSDDHQRVVWKTHSDTWGYVDTAQVRQQEAELNLRLPGQYYDAESGLHDNWHRSYDPRPTSALKGSYLSPDPMGYPDGPDAYAYVNGDPINKTDPMGLYQYDVHYYMTYFLAMAAGMNADDALMMALATQYIDVNPNTQPLQLTDPLHHAERLRRYHFTLWTANGGYSTSTDLLGAMGQSQQLRDLRSYAMPTLPQGSCALPNNRSLQFMGEFLHAFEDTFSHRNEGNRPYPVDYGLGHGLSGSHPDYTYNHNSSEVIIGPLGPEVIRVDWRRNADRTLAMEYSTYQQIIDYLRNQNFYASGRADASRIIPVSELDAVLRRFNATVENDDTRFDGLNLFESPNSPKRQLLDRFLASRGLGAIPTFVPATACQRRRQNFEGLRQADYPAAILTVPGSCT